MKALRDSSQWLALHLGIGLAWVGVLAFTARNEGSQALSSWQVIEMLLVAGWLPSVALAAWQMQNRHWKALLLSDLLGMGVLVLLACTVYVPLFFFHLAWFLPLAMLPRGMVTECMLLLIKRSSN